MNATSPDCASEVTPINAINRIMIGNMWNFLLCMNNSKISLTVESLNICFVGLCGDYIVILLVLFIFIISLILAIMLFPIPTLPKPSLGDFASLFRLHYKNKRVVM